MDFTKPQGKLKIKTLPMLRHLIKHDMDIFAGFDYGGTRTISYRHTHNKRTIMIKIGNQEPKALPLTKHWLERVKWRLLDATLADNKNLVNKRT